MTERIWRETGHCLVSLAIAVAGLVLLVGTLAGLLLIPLAGLGLPILGITVRLTRRLADAQRQRAGGPYTRDRVPSPYPQVVGPDRPRVRDLLQARATWRDVVWLAAQFPVAPVMAFPAVGWVSAAYYQYRVIHDVLLQPLQWLSTGGTAMLGWQTLVFQLSVVANLLAAYALPRVLISAEAWLSWRLLAPATADRLSARVVELAQTRAEALDASAVELRRIERDLHDGAQARLVALTMNLGMAEDLLDHDLDAARAMLAQAHADAHTAMRELRDLVRGVHPPLLADRGLAGAAQALALASPLPVDLDVHLARRLAAPLESAAYFVLAEAITNAIKHSGAERVGVTVTDHGNRLTLVVRDDGHGGADRALGTGLHGLARRLAAFDGTLHLSSPPGGPTLIEAELPCES